MGGRRTLEEMRQMSREGGEAMAEPVSREQLLEVYSHGMHTAA